MLTDQEMFDRAYVGLASQGFQQCTDAILGKCMFSNERGQHCAWGWVDPSTWTLPGLHSETDGPTLNSSVYSLRAHGFGLAGQMTDREYTFASRLQAAHDSCQRPEDMKEEFHRIAEEFDLNVPIPPRGE